VIGLEVSMSVGEMQAVLARLYIDGPFLDLFCERPEAVLGGYRLSSRERSALAGIDRRGVREFAASLRTKTFGRFKSPYRLSLLAEPQAIPQVFRRFYELRPIRPNEKFYEPTLEFGDFLEETLSEAPWVAPYAAELVRYEKLFFRARFGTRPAESPAAPSDVTAAEIGLDFAPRRKPGILLERFDFDMATLEKKLEAGERPEGPFGGPSYVVYKPLRHLGAARKFQLSRPFFLLLSRADGKMTLGEIAAGLEGEIAAPNLADSLRAATRKVFEMGLLAA
jgi:hypothetical protein